MAKILIVGAGPAGASLAYLLAHRGINVTLLERQLDFSREFRGEILMPSGVQAIEQMGLGDAMDHIPRQIQDSITLYLNGRLVFEQALSGEVFSKAPVQAISQPQFLELLVSEASSSPLFNIERGASVKELLFDGERVVGVRARTQAGEQRFHADLVVGADGRASVLRKQGGFVDRHVSPPLDVVWWKIPCPHDWAGPCIFMGRGHFMLVYKSWDGRLQIAWIIIKGSFRQLKDRSLHEWVEEMANHVSPQFSDHLRACEGELEKPFVLDAVSDCVEQWSIPGALLIGDAAHTMSPVGGQGINIALRDSIVATNHLAKALPSEDKGAIDAALLAIENERAQEVNLIQQLQAVPPKIGFSSSWWSEPLRVVVAKVLSFPAVRIRLASRFSPIPFGTADVELDS